jgi:hypothetical protein
MVPSSRRVIDPVGPTPPPDPPAARRTTVAGHCSAVFAPPQRELFAELFAELFVAFYR